MVEKLLQQRQVVAFGEQGNDSLEQEDVNKGQIAPLLK
jgi:hypothetical protein